MGTVGTKMKREKPTVNLYIQDSIIYNSTVPLMVGLEERLMNLGLSDKLSDIDHSKYAEVENNDSIITLRKVSGVLTPEKRGLMEAVFDPHTIEMGWNREKNYNALREPYERFRFLRRFGPERETVTLLGPVVLTRGDITNNTAKKFGYKVEPGAITSKGNFIKPHHNYQRFYEFRMDLDGNMGGYKIRPKEPVLLKVDRQGLHYIFLYKRDFVSVQKYLYD